MTRIPLPWVRTSILSELTDLDALVTSTPMTIERKQQMQRVIGRVAELCESISPEEAAGKAIQ